MRTSILVALSLAVAACGGDGNGNVEHDPDHDADTGHSHPEMRAATDADDVAADVASADGHMTVAGLVGVVGADPTPQVVLTVGAGTLRTQVMVVGDLRDEIGRLSGVEVSVEGDSVANPYGGTSPAVDVLDYDVVSVNSAPAYLGILERRDGEIWLQRDRPYKLLTVPERLENLAGAKVWIVGSVDGDELRVLSYGIVREP